MQEFEKLGSFYLGRPYHPVEKQAASGYFLYDSRDLVTHAVCLGMTGSGKTGLCIALLEEAAIDGIPAIAIDPKGDLTNLLLTFPEMRADDFLPWVNPDDARKKGLSLEEYAAQQSTFWQDGLAAWDESAGRIEKLRQSAEFVIYTPGSTAGIPVSILKSFAAPPQAVLEDPELLQERVSNTATSLLGLIGLEADPIKSREHILLSILLNRAWQNGQDIGLAGLIQQIQSPPVERVGVMELEAFYPARERFALALALNNLLAAPGFQTWLEGDSLDINSILYTPAGKPRLSIFSVAHLNEAERMFFVSLLLNQFLGWMRAQSGTSSLRAILYMDEIFGFFPPVANPPTKKPLLTLLKQARAFGVGIVLATQNPVDLDYKGLSNAGTWFIGRLQTERDKARVLEGLEGAVLGSGSGWDRTRLERLLAGLSNRVFLMNNVHDDSPLVFETRWTLSYLRGPLTRTQIKLLMDPVRQTVRTTETAAPAGSAGAVSSPPLNPAALTPPAVITRGRRPLLDPAIRQSFIPVRSRPEPGFELFYQPALLGAASLHFVDNPSATNLVREVLYLAELTDRPVAVEWDSAAVIGVKIEDLESAPAAAVRFGELPAVASRVDSYAYWTRDFAGWLYRTQKIRLLKSPFLRAYSGPAESERDFRVRLQLLAREQRDAAVEKLRQKYAPRFAALEAQIRQAGNSPEKTNDRSGFSFRSTLLGSFITGRSDRNRAPETAGRRRQSGPPEELRQKMLRLEEAFQKETAALSSGYDAQSEPLAEVDLRPARNAVSVRLLTLAWLPLWQNPAGQLRAAWE